MKGGDIMYKIGDRVEIIGVDFRGDLKYVGKVGVIEILCTGMERIKDEDFIVP